MAGIMIEDQVAPKKCGHTKGKSCVSREEAFARVQAACDARDEGAWVGGWGGRDLYMLSCPLAVETRPPP